MSGAASFGSKSETELLELGFGHAGGNCGAGRWKEVVGHCVRGNNGGGSQCSLTRAGVASF
jgi:hypothetical protein